MSAPKTGHQTAAVALIDEALALFFESPADLHHTPTTGGVNNVTLRIARSSAASASGPAEEFILRIYNNGNNSAKVAFEHEILEQLAQQSLSFQVPRALRSLVAQRTHERLSSGAECCVFHVIPGRLASTTSPEEVGRAAGELSAALGRVQVAASASPTPPYYRLFEVHHAFGAGAAARDRFYSALAPPRAIASASAPSADAAAAAFPSIDADAALRESIDDLLAFIRALELRLTTFEAWALPTAVIHGDLHYDNVLVVGDTVTALLDFEFAAVDWRAMELAVALTKYVSEAEPLPIIDAFVRGYARHGRLTAAECEAVPDLCTLRILSNVIYFTGRALAGEDGIESLTSRAAAYARRVRWLEANADALRAVLRKHISAE